MSQISDFVARMDILCSELEVCLPLAYPSTIYNHFSSLKPLRVDQLTGNQMTVVKLTVSLSTLRPIDCHTADFRPNVAEPKNIPQAPKTIWTRVMLEHKDANKSNGLSLQTLEKYQFFANRTRTKN